MELREITRLEDAQLERLAAAGDAEAFGELYERHSGRLYDYLLRVLRDPDEAADVMQDTFVRALGALAPERAGAAQFSTWLYRIAHNLAVSRLERRARVIQLVPPGDDDEPSGGAVSAALTPEAAAEARELSDLVWEAAQSLDPKQYALLDLHVRQGLDSGEIAAVLGVSKGNAYTMLSRLRQTFESAVAGLVMSRRARGKCAELDAILDAHGDVPINVEFRKRIEQHTSECEICNEQRRALVSASALLRAMPLLPLPLLIKQRVGEAAGEAICANAAAAATSQAPTSAVSNDGASWLSRAWNSSNGVKAAAVIVPMAARLQSDDSNETASAGVVAAADDSTEVAKPSASAAPSVVAPTPTPPSPAQSAVLAESAAPAGIPGARPGPSLPGVAPTTEPGGLAASHTPSSGAGSPSATPTGSTPASGGDDDGDDPSVGSPPASSTSAPAHTATPAPPATMTPRPGTTPRHCEHAQGQNHDECVGDDEDEDEDEDDEDEDDEDDDELCWRAPDPLDLELCLQIPVIARRESRVIELLTPRAMVLLSTYHLPGWRNWHTQGT